MKLKLKQIRADGGTQPRTTIHDPVVAEYAEAMREGAKFPPVTVFFDGKAYWLADGFHRWGAAMSMKLESIECEVRQGTLSDAQWYSFSVNQAHGLRRTNEDKARAVKAALRHSPQRSNLEIARHVGVSDETARKYRAELEAAGEISSSAHPPSSGRCDEADDKPVDAGQPARVVTRKGKTYQMKVGQIGKAKKPRAKKFDGIAKDAAVPIRKPGQMIPTLTISIPLNNPDAAAGALLSNCEPAYLRKMVARITTVLDERGAQ
jgi:transposase-like protein